MQFSVENIEAVERVQADIRLRAVPGFREEVRDAVNSAVGAAWLHAFEHVPVKTGNTRAAIHMTPAPKYRPGGAGGGGSWEASVGVDTTLAPQAAWLLSGTGIYGPEDRTIKPRLRAPAGSIFPSMREGREILRRSSRGKGGVLTFQKVGEERRFRPEVTGQEAQTEWWFGALDVARAVLNERIHSFDLNSAGK